MTFVAIVCIIYRVPFVYVTNTLGLGDRSTLTLKSSVLLLVWDKGLDLSIFKSFYFIYCCLIVVYCCLSMLMLLNIESTCGFIRGFVGLLQR